MKRDRSHGFARQWRMLKLLQSPQTVPGLAAKLETTERTVRRDIVVLEGAGFPLYDDWSEEMQGASRSSYFQRKYFRLMRPLKEML